MSDRGLPDPVTLVAGPALQPRLYRCPDCRAISEQAARLPATGATCPNCSSTISSADVIVYATFGLRALALFLDGLVVGVPTTTLLFFMGWVFTTLAPKKKYTDQLTHTAMVWTTVTYIAVASTIFIAYLVIGNARGRTIGKRATGLAVVVFETGEPPRFTGSLVRTGAQLITIVTLGSGYAIAILDDWRRTLHDRVAGTIVVER
jgi:uncharacterized RDD family membrane protein YckC